MVLKIWGRKSSSNVQATLWCAAELGLEFERIDAGIHYGVNDSAEYLRQNPNGTVPMLIDGDYEPMWETGAILRYLANKYAKSPFWPDEIEARSQVDKWAEWAKINFASKFTAPIFWRVVRTAPSKRDPEAIKAAIDVLGKYLAIADKSLSNRNYIVGDSFTLADIQFGHCLFRYYDIEIDRPSLPNLKRYYQDLCDRPYFREHVQVSYDELRVND